MKLDVKSRTQTETKLTYSGFILSWFCFLFFVYKVNSPRRTISAIALVAFCLAAVYVIVIGFVMRKKLFKQSTETISGNPEKALHLWKAANVVGWCCAMNLNVFGVVLKFLGGSWLVLGIFFVMSLGFLLLWRPRPLPVNGVRPLV